MSDFFSPIKAALDIKLMPDADTLTIFETVTGVAPSKQQVMNANNAHLGGLNDRDTAKSIPDQMLMLYQALWGVYPNYKFPVSFVAGFVDLRINSLVSVNSGDSYYSRIMLDFIAKSGPDAVGERIFIESSVLAMYRVKLKRDPDIPGFTFWLDSVEKGLTFQELNSFFIYNLSKGQF